MRITPVCVATDHCLLARAKLMKLLVMLVVSMNVATAPCRASDGDPRHGIQIYQRCLACHSLEYNRSGPRHCGLFDRQAGTLPDYAYSKAMKASGITWDEPSLD